MHLFNILRKLVQHQY